MFRMKLLVVAGFKGNPFIPRGIYQFLKFSQPPTRRWSNSTLHSIARTAWVLSPPVDCQKFTQDVRCWKRVHGHSCDSIRNVGCCIQQPAGQLSWRGRAPMYIARELRRLGLGAVGKVQVQRPPQKGISKNDCGADAAPVKQHGTYIHIAGAGGIENWRERGEEE